MVGAVLSQVLVVDLHWEGAVALTNQEGGAKVCKRPHKDQQGGSQNGGHGKVHHHLEEPLYPDTAHVGRSLHQGVVNVFKGAVHVDKDQGEQLHGLDKKNAAKAVNAPQLNAQNVLEKHGDNTAAPQKKDPGIGPDEGGGHAAEDTHHEQELGALQVVKGIEVGKGDAQDQGHRCNGDADLEAVKDGLAVVGLGKELGKLLEGKGAFLGDHRLLENAQQRVDKEQSKEHQKQDGDPAPHIKLFLFHGVVSSFPSQPSQSLQTPSRMFREPSSVKRFTFSVLMVRLISVPGAMTLSMVDSWMDSTWVPSERCIK